MTKEEMNKMDSDQVLKRISELELAVAKLRAERAVNVQDKKRYLNQRLDPITYKKVFGFTADPKTGVIKPSKKADDANKHWTPFWRALVQVFHPYATTSTGNKNDFRTTPIALTKLDEDEYEVFVRLVQDIVDLIVLAMDERDGLGGMSR